MRNSTSAVFAFALLVTPFAAISGGCKDSNTVTGPPAPTPTRAPTPTPTPVPPGFTISGTVSGGGGGTLTVWIADGHPLGLSTTAGADGHYALTNVPPGSVTLSATTSKEGYDRATAHATVPPDATDVNLVIRPSH